MDLLWEIAGWAGAAVILGAYLGVSMGWLNAGKAFQTANLLGACTFVINGAFHQAWPSVVTNIAWFLISGVALLRMRPVVRSPLVADDSSSVQYTGVPDATDKLMVAETLPGSTYQRDRPQAAPLVVPLMLAHEYSARSDKRR
jgi:hypothetical protein